MQRGEVGEHACAHPAEDLVGGDLDRVRAGVRLRLRLRLRLRVRAGVRLRLRLRLRLRARAGVRPTIARMSLAESAVSEARVAIFARIASLVSILEELAALL